MQLRGDELTGAIQRTTRFTHPRHQGAGRDGDAIQIDNELSSARKWQELPLRQVHAQGAQIGTILHCLSHFGRKDACVSLTALAHF